jgi:hypothetical protein
MPMPATPKKLPMKAVVTDKPRQPIRAKDRVVRVVAKAPIARAVGLPSCALMVIGTGMYWMLRVPLVELLEALALWPEASFS